MKNTILSLIALASLAFAACTTKNADGSTTKNADGSTTKNADGSTTTTPDSATINNLAGLAFQAAQLYINSRGGNPAPVTTPSKPSTLAFNDLSGVAKLTQAYVGTNKTPLQANVAQGASTSAVGNTIMANLPQAPITQSTVTALTDAATRAKTL